MGACRGFARAGVRAGRRRARASERLPAWRTSATSTGGAGELFLDDSRLALTQLRELGWRHVVLSNHVPEFEEIVICLGLDDLLDTVITSATTGFEKPHPEAFAAGRRAAGDASTVWMVGDNPERGRRRKRS